MYWNLTWSFNSSVVLWLIVTWDVLKPNTNILYDKKSYLINSNMRCIETEIGFETPDMFVGINSNMRCIETQN